MKLLPALVAVLALVLDIPALAQPPTQTPVPPLASVQVQDLPLPRILTSRAAGLPEKAKTLAARPRTPENALALGIVQTLAKQYAQAADTLAPVPEQLPVMAGWAGLYLGLARFRLNDYQGALASLEAGGLSGPAGPGETGGPEDQAAQAGHVCQAGPADPALGPEALLLSAYCLEGLGSLEALTRYRRFLELPNQPLRPVALWRAAVLAASAGDFPTAECSLRELILDSPWTASAEKAEPLARELARAGRTSFDPDTPDSLRERIEVLLDKSQTAKALTLIEQFSAAPGADEAMALYLKGKALYARRDTQASIQLFEDAARLAKEPLLAAWAVYHQGRSYWRLSGPEDAARMEELLGDALNRAKALPEGAELAEASKRLLLLARIERGHFQEALPLARELAASGQESGEAREQAAWLSGLIRFALADYPGAEADLASLYAGNPDSEYAPGTIYWIGRAREAAGNKDLAGEALRQVLARWPNGYYGMLASARLATLQEGIGAAPPAETGPGNGMVNGTTDDHAPGERPAPPGQELAGASLRASVPTPAAACPASDDLPVPEVASPAFERAALLEAGLLPELAEHELAFLAARMPKDPAVALRYARLASDLGDHMAAVRAVSRAFPACLARGSRDQLTPLRDIVYPNRFPELIVQNLAGSSVDPNLLRGLIRQESFFDPDAVSGAGAMGLMQVMPATARTQAEKYGEKNFKTESLKDPAVNIRFGVRYFLERYQEYGGNPALALASYNAGRVKIGVWREFLGGLDQELFVELIPYTETREYVKRILGNQAMYGMLY
jgi:soluble lytic murein transglycosylase